MRIAKLRVVRFRSILDETLECEPLTVLIGRNGAGKSTFLQALRLYLDTNANVTKDDHYNRDDSKEISIEVTFTELTPDEQKEFQSNLDGTDLVVQRKFPSGQYYGQAEGCQELEPLREKLRKKGKVVAELSAELEALVNEVAFLALSLSKRISRKNWIDGRKRILADARNIFGLEFLKVQPILQAEPFGHVPISSTFLQYVRLKQMHLAARSSLHLERSFLHLLRRLQRKILT